MTAALADVDAVVNCFAGAPAAIVRNGAVLFAAIAARPDPVRVIQLSSMAVYGAAEGAVDEAAPLSVTAGAYGAAKVAVERAAESCAEAIMLRPGCIYGPGSEQWSGRIARLLRARRIGDLGAAGDGPSNLVHVDDVVAAILATLRLPRVTSRAYNLAARPLTRWNDYFAALAGQLGAVPLRRITRRRLKIETHVLAAPFRVAGMVAGRLGLGPTLVPDAIPPSLVRLWGQQLELVSHCAETELGLRWTPLGAGLATTTDGVRRSGGR
jgi:nucleoside-diphosphate-sugar epimerase